MTQTNYMQRLMEVQIIIDQQVFKIA